MANKGIGLAEFLAELRSEIEKAQDAIALSKKPALLNLKGAEVEISFGVKKDFKARGGVEFYVFTLEAGGSYGTEEVHKLTVKLEPAATIAMAGEPQGSR